MFGWGAIDDRTAQATGVDREGLTVSTTRRPPELAASISIATQSSHIMLLGLSTTAYQLGFSGRAAGQPAHAAASQVRMDVADVPGLVQGQKYGPTAPAHPAVKPWTNLETQEGVQLVKAKSDLLRQPLLSDMANDEIFVSKDSIHILKHHGSYMQQNRELKKKADRDQSYQFMLRLKVPCGEIPAAVFRELDDLSNTHGQGDLRATTRQAFQLHGVIKGNLKEVISRIANVGARRRLAVARRADAGRRPPAPPHTHCAPPPARPVLSVCSGPLYPRDLLLPVPGVRRRLQHIRRLRRHQPQHHAARGALPQQRRLRQRQALLAGLHALRLHALRRLLPCSTDTPLTHHTYLLVCLRARTFLIADELTSSRAHHSLTRRPSPTSSSR